jgi:hypothetical protein
MIFILQLITLIFSISCGKDDRSIDLRLTNRTVNNSADPDGNDDHLNPKNEPDSRENGTFDPTETPGTPTPMDLPRRAERESNAKETEPNKNGETATQNPNPPKPAEPIPPSEQSISLANRRLFKFYTIKKNYDAVYQDVLTFYPTGRPNGCVAFLSTALRLSNTFVPRNKIMKGYNVSLVTSAFSSYLVDSLGWQVVRDHNKLEPGDVVMTLPSSDYPGIPAHTYMFQSWKNKSQGIGIVIDNQNFSHERNIFGTGTFNFTPFWYALRAPASKVELAGSL